ncbi:MAG: hypothetical protein RXR20_18170, partial [Paraburkholderia sp.]
SGNSLTLDETLRNLTGEGLTSSWLAAECNRSPEEAWARAQDAFKHMDTAAPPPEAETDLDASISIVHGAQCIATNEESLPALYAAFEAWIEAEAWRDRT